MKQSLLRWLLLVAIFASACTTDPTSGDMDATPTPTATPEPTSHKVSVEQALSELEAVLVQIDQNGNDQTRSSSRSVASVATIHGDDVFTATRSVDVPDVEELVYIANFANDQGYAVLAADDRLDSVIAITEQGSLTPEQFVAVANGDDFEDGQTPVLPEVVTYTMRIGGILPPTGGIGGGIGGDGGNLPFTPDVNVEDGLPIVIQTYEYTGPWRSHSKIGPLLHTRWGQGTPYDYFCPSDGNRKSLVGCVAVALGQIVAGNYYTYNRYSTDKIREFGNRNVNWNTIMDAIDSYKKFPKTAFYTNFTNETIEAANLLRAIGREVCMDYSASGSNASYLEAKSFLNRTMKYENAKLRTYTADLVSMMVRDRRLPAFVAGRDWRRGKGHAWVVDGILTQRQVIETRHKGTHIVLSTHSTYRNLFHCNFGWTGSYDGYYLPRLFGNLTEGQVVIEADLGEALVENPGDNNYSQQHWVITYTHW